MSGSPPETTKHRPMRMALASCVLVIAACSPADPASEDAAILDTAREASVSDSPVSDSPVSDSPVSDSPVSDSPVSDAVVLDATIQPDASSIDANDADMSELDASDVPATDASAGDASATDAPLSDAQTDHDDDGVTLEAGDCDDGDPDVHPGQRSYFTTPRADGSYDYDCSGADEPERTASSSGCDVSFRPFECRLGTPGWRSSPAPACGDGGMWVDACNGSYDSTCVFFCSSPDPAMCTDCWDCDPDAHAETQACR